MSPKGLICSLHHTGECMKITMNDEGVVSIAQLKKFLSGVGAISFNIQKRGNKNKQEMYDWVGNLISKVRYFKLRKKEKGVVIRYVESVTHLSLSHIKRLVGIKAKKKLQLSTEKKHAFSTRYSTGDIAKLIETDNAHGRLSGPATKRILEREYREFGELSFERISHISVSHLYNIRKSKKQYTSQALFFHKTKAVNRDIGIRKKPDPQGKPGFLRVDSVHQGDLDKQKGVYHINLVDEVTQWEIIGCVEGISEYFLIPLLEELLDLFPFTILGFHSDNGSEYVNKVVAKLLEKLLIEQTKSRSRQTNDNALVEGKNGAIIRKHMGYTHIQKKHAQAINCFYREHMNVYLNFHRPCGFATHVVDPRGKVKKKYDTYMTPFEKLKSSENVNTYLKCGVTLASLEAAASKESDNACAENMQKAKQKLFEKIHQMI